MEILSKSFYFGVCLHLKKDISTYTVLYQNISRSGMKEKHQLCMWDCCGQWGLLDTPQVVFPCCLCCTLTY